MQFKILKKNLTLFNKIFISISLVLVATGIFGIFINKPRSNNFNSQEFVKRADIQGYINYSAGKSFNNQKNVLFFNANWCSTCTVADQNFLSEMRSIPSYLTIYKVDYSKEIALRQQYSVTIQHTFIQVDHDGNALKKWEGSYTIDEIINQLV